MSNIKKLMTRILFLSCVVMSWGVVAQDGDLKIGFVNIQEVLAKAPQAADAKKRVEKEFSGRQEQLRGIQTEIKSLREKITRDGLTMSDKERKNLESDLLRKDREFRWNQGIIDEDFKIRRSEVMNKLQKDIVKAILEIGQQAKYDLIVTDGVVFASSRVNLTNKVLDELKKSSGAK